MTMTTPSPLLGPPVTKPRVYYFGCGTRRTGHYWFLPDPARAEMNSSSAVDDAMRTVFGVQIDSGFAPDDGPQVEGEARLARIHGWTVLAWWDRSMDTRPNSNSALVIDAQRDFDQMLALLAEHFPIVAKRQRVPIKMVQLLVGE
ncbi:MAG TPA: hypothetical protein VNO75_04105 [Gemmatimonadaceae bacterium]|nr:hypothetical protein [Gemmatimonadaceae bacterium]